MIRKILDCIVMIFILFVSVLFFLLMELLSKETTEKFAVKIIEKMGK